MKATGVVLAGGKSTRMGRKKEELIINGETMLSRALREMTMLFSEVLVVYSQDYKGDLPGRLFPGIRYVYDIFLNKGPLGGVYSGISEASNKYVFITACDMPYIDRNFVRYLVEQSIGFDVVVPSYGDYLEPLCAVYSKACLPSIKESLDQDTKKVTGFYDKVVVRYVPEWVIRKYNSPNILFYNINTPSDWENVTQESLITGKKTRD